jgi:Methylmalonic aciduria and homocystinuria type D protein
MSSTPSINGISNPHVLWGPFMIQPPHNQESGILKMELNSGTISKSSIEVALATLPKPLLREFHHVFPERIFMDDFPVERRMYTRQQGGQLQDMEQTENDNEINTSDCVLLAIPTNQPSVVDLVGMGEAVEQEKDRLLNVFINFARSFCEELRNQHGYWADFIDPCSVRTCCAFDLV